MKNKNKTLKIVIIILSVLLGITLLLFGALMIYRHVLPMSTDTDTVSNNAIGSRPERPESLPNTTQSGGNGSAAGTGGNQNLHTSSDTLPDILLYNKNPGDNTPFQVTNMFPGDVVTKTYRVSVHHKADVTVKYHADIQKGSEKLAEVLQTKIELKGSDIVLYEGLMRDMPESLDHLLPAKSVTRTDLEYEITAWLDTSVGNEYQMKTLVADFVWWVDDEDKDALAPAPETGDHSNIGLFIGIAVGSLLILFLLLIVFRRKKNEEEEQ